VRSWYKGSDISHIKHHHSNYCAEYVEQPLNHTRCCQRTSSLLLPSWAALWLRRLPARPITRTTTQPRLRFRLNPNVKKLTFSTRALYGRKLHHKFETNQRQRGFTAYHPYVADQNTKETLQQVDMGLRKGTYDLLKAGYNVQGITSRLHSIQRNSCT
jgi:hypothetical protein